MARIDPASFLQSVYERFHKRELVGHDPLIFLYDQPTLADREITGLIASGLAYGRVASILDGVRKVLGRMTPTPRRYLAGSTPGKIREDFRGWRYRVTSDAEFTALLLGVKHLLEIHGSLKPLLEGDEPTILPGLGRLVDALSDCGGADLRHLLPHPDRGSACKRLNLFLRWMVRRDQIDPGGWESLGAHRLIMPVDVHIHRVSRRLGLTRRKGANLKTAEQITARLRRICPEDPLKFDFALTRPGILGLRERDLRSGN